MLSNPQAFSADQDGCLQHTGEKLHGGVPTELQSTSGSTDTALLRSAPGHITPLHHPRAHTPCWQETNPRAASPSPQAAVNLEIREVSRVSREEEEEHSPPRAPQRTGPGRYGRAKGRVKGGEGDDRDRMTVSSSTQPFVLGGPLGCSAQGGQVLLLPLQGERMRGGKQCSLLSCLMEEQKHSDPFQNRLLRNRPWSLKAQYFCCIYFWMNSSLAASFCPSSGLLQDPPKATGVMQGLHRPQTPSGI